MSTDHSKMDRFFSGHALFGDDFSQEQIDLWYADEEEGYSQLEHEDARSPVYIYHALNERFGFRHLPKNRVFKKALGFGSAFGEEFRPISSRLEHLTILDASDSFVRERPFDFPVEFAKAQSSGRIPFADNQFDLITCFGVLHHVPNVSFVLSEISRCLAEGGYALIREPLHSMGDWRHPRAGLTKRERGIPYSFFEDRIRKAGFTVVKRSFCVFSPLSKLLSKLGLPTYSSPRAMFFDDVFSRMFSWNRCYHRTHILHRFGPASVFYVLTKGHHPG